MKRLLILCFVLCILCVPVCGVELPDGYLSEMGVDDLQNAAPGETDGVLDDYSFLDFTDVDDLFSSLGDKILSAAQEHFRGAAKSAVVVLAVTFLCSLASAFFPGGKAPEYVTIAGVFAIVTAVVTDTGALIQDGTETLYKISDFSTILLPCLSGIAATSGAVVSASAKCGATMLFMNVLLTVCVRFIAPLINVYLACVIANAAFENRAFSAMASLVKWICMTSLTLFVVAFTAYLSVSGVITASGDLVTTRFAKAAISTALPVVGKIVSDAASTVVAGVSVLRNSVGIFGMIAVLCITIAPFVSMGVRYLLFKAASSAASVFPDQRFSGLIDGIGTAFGMMMAMTGTGAVMLFISLISLIRTVSG